MKLQTEKMLVEKAGTSIVLLDGSARFQRMPESELWDLFRAGDEAAFHYLYITYFPILFTYGHQFTPDRELVKDVIQDLFIYLKEKRHTLGPTTAIKFYLYTAYRRRIVRYLSQKKHNCEDAKGAINAGFDIALSQESFIVDQTTHEEYKQKLEHAFNVLTPRQREVIIYYFYEDFSYEEIASLMGFSKVQYARIQVSRSIAKLRKVLGKFA
uniref:Sigma-70 family RNA polymerase sigma factor n=1 Tax=Roseihalotalea indica TaxID=2867963 RepID=A0AA49JK53_9BACT|nr:sigma-70 family RNA polymerase sigma factor [Tunicatimonas sp. TK19036]